MNAPGGFSGGDDGGPAGAAARPLPGSVISGKYVVEHLIGEGGMGYVVAARHLQLQRRVALKFLRPDAALSPETTARFLHEAQAASRITSENVARVVDVGTLETGVPFMVMEYLEGKDLGAVLEERRGPIPASDAVDWVLQAMEALGEAHLAGIIHRDIKPSNLFLTRRADGSPLIKVLDFGLAKDVSSSRREQSLTRSTTGAMGSPLYMAPEQVRSAKAVSFASDVWSLGVVLYELLTNDVPFHGDNVGELLAAILADEAKPLGRAGQTFSPELERVVMRCLDKRPGQRWPDLASLASALLPFATPRGRVSHDRIVAMYAAAGHGPAPQLSSSVHAAPGHAAPLRSALAVSAAGASTRSSGDGTPRMLLLAGGALLGALAVTFTTITLLSNRGAAPGSESSTAAPELPARSPTEPAAAESVPVPAPSPSVEVGPSSADFSTGFPSASAPAAPPPSAKPSGQRPHRAPRTQGGAGAPAKPAPSKPSIDDLVKQGRH